MKANRTKTQYEARNIMLQMWWSAMHGFKLHIHVVGEICR